MFEIDNKFITNRPDLFSVVGNAREFHAVFNLPTFLSPYTLENDSRSLSQNRASLNTKVESKNCLSYHLLEMRDIEVGKSPL
jgi:phenylalanyl-tRNA synthetase beta subunit